MLPPYNKIETRTWNTKYRGLVLICASLKKCTLNDISKFSSQRQIERIVIEGMWKKEGHLGMAIGIGELIDSRPMTKQDEAQTFIEYKEPWFEYGQDKISLYRKEKQLYCHVYKNMQPIVPFPFKGAQGWKKLTEEEKSKIIYL